MALRVRVKHTDGSISAYKRGSIEDYVDELTEQVTPAATVAAEYKTHAEEAQAAGDPSLAGATFKIEELVDNGDGTSTWK